MEKTYDTLVCLAVRNDPYGFVDALIEEAGRAENRRLEPMLRLSLIHISEPTRPY